jgi:hypothetical protein
MRAILLGLIVIGALLYVSNPGPAELREKLSAIIMAKIDKEAGNNGGGAEQLGKLLIPALVFTLTIERRDFLLFSLYRVGAPGDAGGAPVPRCVIGVAKQFIPLEKC